MSWLDRLRFRRDAPGEPGPEEAAPIAGIVVEALDASGSRQVRLEIGDERVSDALNDRDRELRATLAGDVENADSTDSTAEPGQPIDLDEIALIIPPAQEGDRARRLHRPGQPLWVRIGPFSVSGDVHPPPGAVGAAYLLRRSPRFFVLTDATISRRVPGGADERRASVLLVNFRQVESLRDSPEPDPVPHANEPLPGEPRRG